MSEPINFDEWMAQQDQAVRSAFDAHVSGLKSALESERDARGKLEKQVKDFGPLQDQLKQAQSQLSQTARKADFYEAIAGRSQNPKLAYLAAVEGQHFTDDGQPDIEGLAGAYPELFALEDGGGRPPGNAGKGTQKKPKTEKPNMDTFIRKVAGVG